MNGEALPDTIHYIPPKAVIHRGSTDTIAVDNPNLAKALSFIDTNYANQISVADVADSVEMTMNGLINLFRRYLDRTPGQHIRRLRMKRACVLLRTSDLRVKKIAYLVGYKNYYVFYEAFVKRMECSPKAYRANV